MMQQLQILCASLLILANITNGAKLVLESDNKVIYPVATKKLNLRCSVKKGNSGLPEHSPNIKNSSKELGATSVSSEELFEHLMSIVITEGKRQTIASVTGCDKPVIERAFEGVVTAVGQAENSSELEEMGHLTLTWDRPLLKDADNFTCEAFALNPDKSSVSLSVSLEITVEPNLSELLEYISSNDRQVEILKQSLTPLQETFNSVQANILQLQGKANDFDTALAGLKSQNIQSGTFECRDVITIKFAKSFDFPPKMFSSIIDLKFEGHHGVGYTIKYVSINTTHFSVKCTLGAYEQYISAKVQWIAIDS